MRKKKIDFDLDESAMNVFNNRIEEIRKESDTYTEAIISYCEDSEVEIEDIIPLISNGLKEKMRLEELSRKNIVESKNNISENDMYA